MWVWWRDGRMRLAFTLTKRTFLSLILFRAVFHRVTVETSFCFREQQLGSRRWWNRKQILHKLVPRSYSFWSYWRLFRRCCRVPDRYAVCKVLKFPVVVVNSFFCIEAWVVSTWFQTYRWGRCKELRKICGKSNFRRRRYHQTSLQKWGRGQRHSDNVSVWTRWGSLLSHVLQQKRENVHTVSEQLLSFSILCARVCLTKLFCCETSQIDWSWSDANKILSTGNLESAPVLVRKLGLHYEFEWRTAAACVQTAQFGTNCRVFDDELGTNEDLLSSQSHSHKKIKK